MSRIVPRYNFRGLGAPVAFRALHNTCAPRNVSPALSLSIPLAPVIPSWQVRFYLCKAFLRHSSPSCLLDDLEELQRVACILSWRTGKDKVCFQNENWGFFYKTQSNLDFVFHTAWEVDLLCERGFSFKLIIRRIYLNLCQYRSHFRCSGMLCLFLVVWRKNIRHFPPCSYWGQWKKIPVSC